MLEDYLKEDHLEADEEQVKMDHSKKLIPHELQAVEEELEHTILEEVHKLERQEDTISADIERKLFALLAKTSNDPDERLKLRMSELALSKILVYTHSKSEFRLVLAHHHIGKAYLDYRCYEQAIDHLTLALKKNSKLNELRDVKLYHSFLLVTLSRCYFQIASFEDALEVLHRAEEIQTACLTESQIANAEILRLKSRCYSRLKIFSKAHQCVDRAIRLFNTKLEQRSVEVGKLRLQKATLFNQEKRFVEAIQELTAAKNLIGEATDQTYNAEIYELLAECYENNSQPQKQLETLELKLQAYVQIWGDSHKKTLKLKESIAMLCIKSGQRREAIAQLKEILETEETVYGGSNAHVGKILKTLGLVHSTEEGQIHEAEHYLKRAQKVFQEQGNVKVVKEIKMRLTSLKDRQKGGRADK